jgi:hypothetical protein
VYQAPVALRRVESLREKREPDVLLHKSKLAQAYAVNLVPLSESNRGLFCFPLILPR